MVDSERLHLASAGLPQDGIVGFSLFDKTSIFQGDSFTEQINYTRALEGELTRTIGQVEGVLYDRVNIVLPQQELFSSQQANPTASVLLKLSPSSMPAGDQIAGIQHLVASAVQGLKPGDVTVVDGNGTILSTSTDSGDMGALGQTALQVQARYASNVQAQLAAMLDSVLGPDHAVVRVQDSMDWTQTDATSSIYAPQSSSSPLTASHTVENISTGPGGTTGGVAGLGSNIPTYGAKAGATNAYTTTARTADVTYTNSMTVTHVIAPPGTIKQLSVAVVLNGVNSTAEIASLRQAVSAAAGLVPARGDVLTITSVPFDSSADNAAATAAAAQAQRDMILNIVRWLALIVVPLVLLFLLRRLLLPSRLRKYNADALANLQVLEDQAGQLHSSDTLVALPSPRDVMRDSLTQLAREKPEIVAGLIGQWIDEDRA
jgi:flagellar M-ring protein FliF